MEKIVFGNITRVTLKLFNKKLRLNAVLRNRGRNEKT
jgi:hypothetical protein